MAGPATWSLAQVRKRLEALSKQGSGKTGQTQQEQFAQRAMAMCYKPSRIEPPKEPERVEYICPTCGQRTYHTRLPASGSLLSLSYLVQALPAYRAQAKAIPNLDVSIDETNLCSHCTPETGKSTVALVVRLKGGTNKRTETFSNDDLALLAEFAKGKKNHQNGQPLQDSSPRLKELLGVDE